MMSPSQDPPAVELPWGAPINSAEQCIFERDCRVVGSDDDAMGIRSTAGETYLHGCLAKQHNQSSTS